MKKFRVRNYQSYNTIRRIYDNLISKFSVQDLRTQPKIGYKFVLTTENIKKVKNLFDNESNTSKILKEQNINISHNYWQNFEKSCFILIA